jgi:hypothetical protein
MNCRIASGGDSTIICWVILILVHHDFKLYYIYFVATYRWLGKLTNPAFFIRLLARPTYTQACHGP